MKIKRFNTSFESLFYLSTSSMPSDAFFAATKAMTIAIIAAGMDKIVAIDCLKKKSATHASPMMIKDRTIRKTGMATIAFITFF